MKPMDTIDPLDGTKETRLTDAMAVVNGSPVLPEGDVDVPGAVDSGDPARQRMCFRIGELGLLFPWEGGREVIAPLRVTRIPNTVSWFQGLANVSGGLV